MSEECIHRSFVSQEGIICSWLQALVFLRVVLYCKLCSDFLTQNILNPHCGYLAGCSTRLEGTGMLRVIKANPYPYPAYPTRNPSRVSKPVTITTCMRLVSIIGIESNIKPLVFGLGKLLRTLKMSEHPAK